MSEKPVICQLSASNCPLEGVGANPEPVKPVNVSTTGVPGIIMETCAVLEMQTETSAV